jgi:hypothetical protein
MVPPVDTKSQSRLLTTCGETCANGGETLTGQELHPCSRKGTFLIQDQHLVLLRNVTFQQALNKSDQQATFQRDDQNGEILEDRD